MALLKNDRTRLFLLIAIFAIAFFLRFYRLGEIPNGLYQDETAIGYNAFSLLETGRDEYGKSFPLYFKSFGDYKLPVYVYLTAFSIKIFGLSAFGVRLSSALFGFLTVIVLYFFVRKLTNNERLAVFSTALLSVNPWHLHYSRATFEVSISLFLFLLGGLFLIMSFKNGKRGSFFFGTLCFVLALYTYNLTRMLAPLLYAAFIILKRKELSVIKKNVVITTALVSFLLLLPFLLSFFTAGGVSSASGTLLFSSKAVQAPLLELRSYLIGLPAFFVKVFFGTVTLTVWQFFLHVASYFSVAFFFLSGSPHGNHGIGNVGQFYLFEFPLMLAGVVALFQQKKEWGRLLFAWFFITVAVASLTREAPHATRSFFLIVPLTVFSAYGLLLLISIISKIENKSFRTIILICSAAFIFYNLVYYFTSYYVRFPVAYASSWRSVDKELSVYLREHENEYDAIVIDKNAGFVYSSYLFYNAFSPKEFQSSVVRSPDDSEGFSNVERFGKIEYRNIDWTKDYARPKTLFVVALNRKQKDIPSLRTFYYPKRPVVLSLGAQLVQYPVEDVAYEIVASK